MDAKILLPEPREKLSLQVLIRISPDLQGRLSVALKSIPALRGTSRSSFIRQAIASALYNLEFSSSEQNDVT